MRTSAWLGLVVALLGLSRAVLAGPPATSKPPVQNDQQVSDLRKAAEHLEKSGMTNEAATLRATIKQLEKNGAGGLQAEKQRELEALQAEVQQLRNIARPQPQVAVTFTLIEFNREKLQAIEIKEVTDFLLAGQSDVNQNASAGYGVAADSKKLAEQLDSLRNRGLVKVLGAPTIVTVSGRPAAFHSGGEIPQIVGDGRGGASIKREKYGTEIEFTPFVIGADRVRLLSRVSVSELDKSNSVTIHGNTFPGLKTRTMSGGYEMGMGETLILKGSPRTVHELQIDKSGKQREVTNAIDLVTLIKPSHPEPSAQPLDHSVHGTYHPAR